MLTARSMLNRRRERITLQALQPVVESYAGRQFKVSAPLAAALLGRRLPSPPNMPEGTRCLLVNLGGVRGVWDTLQFTSWRAPLPHLPTPTHPHASPTPAYR